MLEIAPSTLSFRARSVKTVSRIWDKNDETAGSSASGSLEPCAGRMPPAWMAGCFRIGILRTARKSLRARSLSDASAANFPDGATHQYTLFLCQREIRMLVRSSLHGLFSHSGAKTLWGRSAGQIGLRHRHVVNLALSQQRPLQEVSTASSRMRGTTKRLKEHVFGQLEASDRAGRRALN